MGNTENLQGILTVEGKYKFSFFFLRWGYKRKSCGGIHGWDHIWSWRKNCEYLCLGTWMETNNEAEWLSLYSGMYLVRKINITKIIVIGDLTKLIHKMNNRSNRGIIKSKIIYERIQHISEETKDSYILLSEAIMQRRINWQIKDLRLEWGWPR